MFCEIFLIGFLWHMHRGEGAGMPEEIRIGLITVFPQIDELATVEFALEKLYENQIVPESTKFV